MMLAIPTPPIAAATPPSARKSPVNAVRAAARAARMLDGLLTCTPSGCAGFAVNGSTLATAWTWSGSARRYSSRRMAAEGEQRVSDREAHQCGLVDLRRQRHWPQDADHGEILAAQVDLGSRLDAIDPEGPRGHRAQHDGRIAPGRRVEERSVGHAAAERAEQPGLGGEHGDAAAVDGGHQGCPQHGRSRHVPDRRHRLDRRDVPDHGLGRQRQRGGRAIGALAGGDREQVGLGAELAEQIGPGRGGDAEHRDTRRDPDRDAERGQRRPQLSRARRLDQAAEDEVRGPLTPGTARRHPTTMRPSRIITRRSIAAATAWSCVTTTTAVPSSAQPGQQGDDLRAGRGVEVSGRLIGQDHVRAPGDSPGDRHPLALATRQLGGPVREPAGPARPGPGRDRRGPPVACPRAPVEQAERHVLHRVEMVEQVELLEDEAKAARADPGQLSVGQRWIPPAPPIVTLPRVGRSSVPRHVQDVVLPEPEGPSTTARSAA